MGSELSTASNWFGFGTSLSNAVDIDDDGLIGKTSLTIPNHNII